MLTKRLIASDPEIPTLYPSSISTLFFTALLQNSFSNFCSSSLYGCTTIISIKLFFKFAAIKIKEGKYGGNSAFGLGTATSPARHKAIGETLREGKGKK